MLEKVDEQVEVAMIYAKNGGKTWPCLIKWRNKRWRVSAIGFKHYIKRGEVLVHVYEFVTQERLWMRLEHNTLLNTWTLDLISDGEVL